MLISLGMFLLVLGAVLLAIGIMTRFLPRLEGLPPILYVQKTFDGITVGTSPIVIIVLIALYLVLLVTKISR